jgi:hypothetical protein
LIDFMGKDVQRAYSYRIGCFQVIFIESWFNTRCVTCWLAVNMHMIPRRHS